MERSLLEEGSLQERIEMIFRRKELFRRLSLKLLLKKLKREDLILRSTQLIFLLFSLKLTKKESMFR
jgi:hypothetical protein